MRANVSNVPDDNGEPDPHVFQIGGVAFVAPPERARTVEAPKPPLAYDIVAAPAPPVTKDPSAPISAPQLLGQLRARLRVVEREIKARQKLEAERDQIKRLIAAAKNERNNLRAIRAAG